jgi:hypothetical protein
MGMTAMVFTTEKDWHFPRALVVPLIYWILVCSVGGYFIVTWAIRHLPASQASQLRMHWRASLCLLMLPWTTGVKRRKRRE